MFSYKNPDQYVVVNDGDEILRPIKIPLPKCPQREKIGNYGMDPAQQKFTAPIMPPKLRKLNAERYDNIETYWNEIEKNFDYYKDELYYIQQQWDRRVSGYWFYNNGIPTYITGQHYFFLTAWHINSKRDGIKLPEYRSRDRKFFLFADFCKQDPDCFGFNYPKHRIEGATSKVSCINFEMISRFEGAHGGIQSKTGEDAEKVFRNFVVLGFRRLPFYFKPIYDGTTNPKEILWFTQPARKISKEMETKGVDTLEGTITYGSSIAGYYDGKILRFLHFDESGKSTEVDIRERHRIAKTCLASGGDSIISGQMINTSTVGEMEKGGGEKFMGLCMDSMYEKRDGNNQTLSGLYNLFMPAYDGLEGCIDEYGNSVIETPKRPIMGIHGKWITIGAKERLSNRRNALIKAGNDEELIEEIRKFPINFKECFTKSAKSCRFNLMILNRRITDLQISNPFVRYGNLKWEGNPAKLPRPGQGRILWEDGTKENSKFEISHFPVKPNNCRLDQETGLIVPGNTHKYCAGGDPTSTRGKTIGEPSLAAGAVFRKYDSSVDSPLLDPLQINPKTGDFVHTTNRFCCTYLNRPRLIDDFCEDMIMMCVYFGCEMFPEINVNDLWQHFERRGYEGYLFYRRNPKTGLLYDTPGAHAVAETVEDIFNQYQSWIQRHAAREVHLKLLEQCKEIDADMSRYDLFAAGGYALLANKKEVYYEEKVSNKASTVGAILEYFEEHIEH